MEQKITTHTLSNGLELAIERLPHMASAALGFWIEYGSRHEQPEVAGISHMVEHMLFKGTSELSSTDIAEQIDMLGGNVDAFTTREGTAYVAKIRDIHLEQAFDLISAMILDSQMLEHDVAMERDVILEELRMVHDTPDDLVNEYFFEKLFPGHMLGSSILGSEETIKSMTTELVKQHYTSVYHPGNITITAAGNVNAELLLELVEKRFGAIAAGERPDSLRTPAYGSGLSIYKRRRLEQVQLMYGLPTFHTTDPRRYALEVLSTYLGGSMSSRLFQEIREKRGLAYTIHSFTSSFLDSGFMGIYAATSPERLQELITVLEHELKEVLEKGIDQTTLDRLKTMIETELVLGLEGSSSRMSLMARQLQYFGKLRSIDTLIQELRLVDMEAITALIQTILDTNKPLVTILGPVEKAPHIESLE